MNEKFFRVEPVSIVAISQPSSELTPLPVTAAVAVCPSTIRHRVIFTYRITNGTGIPTGIIGDC